MSDEVISSGISDSGSFPDASTRSISEAVITPPCHGGITGSNPVRSALGLHWLFDCASVTGINANNIVSFERVAVAA